VGSFRRAIQRDRPNAGDFFPTGFQGCTGPSGAKTTRTFEGTENAADDRELQFFRHEESIRRKKQGAVSPGRHFGQGGRGMALRTSGPIIGGGGPGKGAGQGAHARPEGFPRAGEGRGSTPQRFYRGPASGSLTHRSQHSIQGRLRLLASATSQGPKTSWGA